jgi:hypothetical protein
MSTSDRPLACGATQVPVPSLREEILVGRELLEAPSRRNTHVRWLAVVNVGANGWSARPRRNRQRRAAHRATIRRVSAAAHLPARSAPR